MSLPLEESLGFLYSIIDSIKNTALISNDFCIPGTLQIPVSRYRDYLGQQTDSLIFDARRGIHLNALYACVGMVSVNGIIVVLLPNNNKTDTHRHESEYGIRFTYGFLPEQSYFSQLFVQQALKHNAASITPTLSHLPRSVLQNKYKWVGSKINTSQDTLVTLSDKQVDIKTNIIEQITQHLSTTTTSIILGSRGRGKSTLLAHIAHELIDRLHALGKTVVVSALHKKQLNTFYKHATQLQLRQNEHAVTSPSCIVFYSLDEIITRAPKNAIVLIDEISSVAPQLLHNIFNNFSHCVFSGTTSGYEGSGKGFLHRVLPLLQNSQGTELYSLSETFRWLDGDAVETCLNAIMGNKQATISPSMPETTASSEITFYVIDSRSLLENETLYMQFFALLAEAHYQTTPNDIVRTLDAPDCKIAIAEHKALTKDKASTIVGVAILFYEGSQLLAPLAKNISIGKRRVQGHLTPQSLSLSLFCEDVATLQYLRVNRIAVHNRYKRLGIGSKLLNYCENIAKLTNIDFMSVSYGYTRSLDSFWRINGYELAKLGYRIDSASGTSSVIMIKTLNNAHYLPNDLLKFITQIDYKFMCCTNDRLAVLYEYLFTPPLTVPYFDNKIVKAYINKVIALFVNRQINVEKASPVLLWCLNNSKFAFNSDKTAALIQHILTLTHKGTHKHVKNASEQTLYDAVKHHYLDF
jgi:tRNA(Met) cytidine acetyltransferase